jgi:hypothetical protein
MITYKIHAREAADTWMACLGARSVIGLLGLMAIGVLPWSVSAAERDVKAPESQSVLDRVERKIAKEPKYNSTPKYALVVLGDEGKTKLWMVEDGKALYIDKNANGDLTDDGPPIEPTNVRDLGAYESAASRWDFDYLLDEITPADGSRHTDFCLRRWNYGGKTDSYGLSLNVNGRMPMYAGWFGTFWAASPEAVPIIHFGGPLEPCLLGQKELVIGAGVDRLNMAFMNRGRGAGAVSYLSIDALPKAVVPKLRIDWPVADGAPSVQTSEALQERCCYWAFYEPNFTVPEGVAAGDATVTVSFEGGEFPFGLTTNQVRVPVIAKPAERPAE